MAVEAGAVHVQGTFTGIGERCGNADLSIIVPNLKLKKGLNCSGDVSSLFNSARKIAEIANTQIDNSKPYTGASAFAHKAGMHIDGVLKLSRSFEHINPEAVGNQRRFLMSEVSGRSTVVEKIRYLAPHLSKDSPEIAEILKQLKELEHFGYHFEAADASFELLEEEFWVPSAPLQNRMFKTGRSRKGTLPAYAGSGSVDGGKSQRDNGPATLSTCAQRKALRFSPANPQCCAHHKVACSAEQLCSRKSKGSIKARRYRFMDNNSVSSDIIEASLIAHRFLRVLARLNFRETE